MSNPDAPPPYDETSKTGMYPNPNAPPYGPYPPGPGASHHSNTGYTPSYQPNLGGVPPVPPPMHNPNVTNTTYVYVADNSFGPRPVHITCPHCHQQIVSRVKYNAGLLSWLLVGGCLIFGCWAGCCLIPLCVEDCQDAEHFCSNCKAYLGTYKRI